MQRPGQNSKNSTEHVMNVQWGSEGVTDCLWLGDTENPHKNILQCQL